MNTGAMFTWVSTLGTGILSAICGTFAVGFLGTLCVRWYRVSGFEGGAGYFVALFGLLGAVCGLVIGIVASRLVVHGAEPHFFKGLALALSAACGLTMIAGVLCWLAADHPPKIQGKNLALELELRTPPGYPRLQKQENFTPSLAILRGGSAKSGGYGSFDFDHSRQEANRWIIPAMSSLFTSYAGKTVWVSLETNTQLNFNIPLRSHPRETDMNWTDWQEASSIYKASAWLQSTQMAGFNLRYRVRLEEPPSPTPSREEVENAQAAREQAEFEQLAPDAPLSAWLRYTRYGTPEERLRIAIARISSRPGLPAELDAMMRDADAQVASDATRIIAKLPEPTPALAEALVNAGHDLTKRLERTVTLTPQQDPSYVGAADISVRFSAWIEAARALRAKSLGDFSPELRSILQLARQRPESQALRTDVVRVASYYLQQWTGEAPLPTDPPPR